MGVERSSKLEKSSLKCEAEINQIWMSVYEKKKKVLWLGLELSCIKQIHFGMNYVENISFRDFIYIFFVFESLLNGQMIQINL